MVGGTSNDTEDPFLLRQIFTGWISPKIFHRTDKMAKLNSSSKKTSSAVGIAEAFELRKKAGLGMTPLMVIYVIDKDSNKGERGALNTTENLVGISFAIPENPSGEKGMEIEAQYMMIPLERLSEKDNRTDV